MNTANENELGNIFMQTECLKNHLHFLIQRLAGFGKGFSAIF